MGWVKYVLLLFIISASYIACAEKPQKSTSPAPTPALPIIEEFYCNPQGVLPRFLSTLKWVVTGATMVSIDQGINYVAPTGERIIYLTENTTYTLTATNAAGTVTRTALIYACQGCGCYPSKLTRGEWWEVYVDTVDCFDLRYPSMWIIDKERFATVNRLAGGVLS